MAGVVIEEVPRARLGELEPLWEVLWRHHHEVTPHLRERELSPEESWQARRRIESDWLQTEPNSFAIAAREDDGWVGYAFVRVRVGESFAASWHVSDPLAELATLVVLPDYRRSGVGTKLMDHVEEQLRELGVEDMLIGVITTNRGAIRMYERRGAVPFVTDFIQPVRREAASEAKDG